MEKGLLSSKRLRATVTVSKDMILLVDYIAQY